MGWMRTFFLGDIGNRLDIQDVENELAEARRRHRADKTDLQQRIDALERETDQLKLCVTGLVRLLVRRGAFRRDDLVALIGEIDREDGKQDGRSDAPLV